MCPWGCLNWHGSMLICPAMLNQAVEDTKVLTVPMLKGAEHNQLHSEAKPIGSIQLAAMVVCFCAVMFDSI